MNELEELKRENCILRRLWETAELQIKVMQGLIDPEIPAKAPGELGTMTSKLPCEEI